LLRNVRDVKSNYDFYIVEKLKIKRMLLMINKMTKIIPCTFCMLLIAVFCHVAIADTTKEEAIFELNGIAIYKTPAYTLISAAKARDIEVAEDTIGGTVKIKIASSALATEILDLYNRAMSRTDDDEIVLVRNNDKNKGADRILTAMIVNKARKMITGIRLSEEK